MISKEYPLQPVVAVGAVVFRNGRVLLVKRGKPPADGLWSIPGGSVQLGETLQEAAQREIMEETGVTIKAGEPVYTFEVMERNHSGRIRFHYVIIDLTAVYVKGTPRAGDDAKAAQWISAPELDTIDVNPRTRKLLADKFGFGL